MASHLFTQKWCIAAGGECDDAEMFWELGNDIQRLRTNRTG